MAKYILKMNEKHKSKLHKGFLKMVARQDAKPSIQYIQIVPVIMSFDEKSYEYIPLERCVWNNKWNGMNLKVLANRFQQTMPGWFNSHKTIDANGKYCLSIRGKQYLNRKKEKKIIKINSIYKEAVKRFGTTLKALD